MAEEAERVGDRTLAEQCRVGDEDAFSEIYQRYARKLINLARSRISERLSARIEAEDVVQSVFRTFFGRVQENRFHFEQENDLWKLLVSMTMNKLRNKVDWHTAAKRDVGAERRMDGNSSLPSAFAPDGETPSPSAVVAFLDLLEHFLSGLREQDRKILELRLQDLTQQEIADQIGCTERTVRRVLERIRGVAEEQGVREQLSGK
ncbi:RNA polymerase sigma factor [Planctomycetes bacterium Pan216]|uniref:RNA polymerase sigma factor n=1 Tax=Kolteria novifilia TaxID=2527975 RepID=A0A518B1X6_9BACT|nr:RNA polymerase sigma factor [Planctomycetes bacterium Pan216]